MPHFNKEFIAYFNKSQSVPLPLNTPPETTFLIFSGGGVFRDILNFFQPKLSKLNHYFLNDKGYCNKIMSFKLIIISFSSIQGGTLDFCENIWFSIQGGTLDFCEKIWFFNPRGDPWLLWKQSDFSILGGTLVFSENSQEKIAKKSGGGI